MEIISFYYFISHILFVLCYEDSLKSDTFNKDCLMIPENPYSTLILKLNNATCPQYNCWESQLTLGSKARLTWEYNNFRNSIAKRENIDVMMKTLWHWSLEKEAMLILQDCHPEGTVAFETRDVEGLDYNMNCEETIMKVTTPGGIQQEFINSFPTFLNNENDPLDNFDDEGNFRRISATHFGCAFMITNEAPYKSTLVCVYCTNLKSISDKPSECPGETRIGMVSDFPALCAYDPEGFLNHLYACHEYDSSLDSICTEVKPPEWKATTKGHKRTLHLISNEKVGFVYFIEDPKPEGLHQTEEIIYCKDLGGCPPPIPAWYYVYGDNKLRTLNRTVHKLTHGNFIRFPEFNSVIKIDHTMRTEYLKASCCLYLFILYLLMFIAVIGILYFIYKHRMMMKIK